MDANQMDALATLLHVGSLNASEQLAKWIGKPSIVEIHSLERLPFDEAAQLLGTDGQPMCFCISEISGILTGVLILAFDDSSGLELVDMLLDHPAGTSDQWTEMAISAVKETTNILGCAYLNALSQSFVVDQGSAELLPSPPKFSRDFAPCLLQFALMGQAISSEEVILAKTGFEIDGTPSKWTLLLVPDAPSMTRLAKLLSESRRIKKGAD